MPKISERKWRKALTSVLEELEMTQYLKMLEYLDEIPKSLRTDRKKEQMPKTIIEHLGLDDSISAISNAMDHIPRRDSAVQDLLRPFVDKLRRKQEKQKNGKKRKHESDSESEDEKQKPAAGFKKNSVVSDSESSCSSEQQEPAADKQRSCRPDKRKTICDLKTSGNLDDIVIMGKVVVKSDLRTYQTKEKVKRFYFYLAVADETSSIKVMVYGEEHYKKILENNSYLFKNVIMEENLIKVTSKSIASRTPPIEVPRDVELEAQMLIYHQGPVFSITDAKNFDDKSRVAVEGTVKEIGPVKPVSLKNKRRKKLRQDFKLKDDVDSIEICLWGDDIKQLRGISEGDSVRVINVMTSHYCGTVSLNSTDFTKIFKVQSAAVQNVRIEVIGITSATKMETRLEAEFNSQVETFVVASPLLAKAFGVRLDGDFEDRLLDIMPLVADAEIQGNKIIKIRR